MGLYYKLPELKLLLKNYYNLTNIRVALFDQNFREIVSYPAPLSPFCQALRLDPLAKQDCLRCDYRAFHMCQNTANFYSYQCHAGLMEAVLPIQLKHVLVGYVMLGQIVQTSSKTQLWQQVVSHLTNYSIDLPSLHSLYQKKPNVTSKFMGSSLKMLEILVDYMLKHQFIAMKQNPIAQQIDDFISENLRRDLSTEVICQRFQIGKTKLYEIAKQNYSLGIAQHVTRTRMERAKQYLLETDMLIYEIADKVGFYDYNYFTKVFKKVMGCSPKALKKSFREGEIPDETNKLPQLASPRSI